jgi:DNA-binding response OmpR family regulator
VGAGYTLLLIDDDPGILTSLTAMLQALSDFTVVTARDGVEGLEQCAAAHPDCIIVDGKMPELDGFQFVRALRGDLATATTPISFLSAMVQVKDKLTGMAAGGDIYLTKPVKPLVLLAAIHDAIVMTTGERERRQRALAEGDGLPRGDA